MKTERLFMLITPLALLVAGCSVPARPNTTVADWVQYGQLPHFALAATGTQYQRVYSETTPTYPYPNPPRVVVESDQQPNRGNDLALAESIRRHIQYDRGLAPSLQDVTIAVADDGVILRGTVKSELDARVIVDDLRDVNGVTDVRNDLEITPD